MDGIIKQPGLRDSYTEMTGGRKNQHFRNQHEGLWLGISTGWGQARGECVHTVNPLLAGPAEPLVHVPQEKMMIHNAVGFF